MARKKAQVTTLTPVSAAQRVRDAAVRQKGARLSVEEVRELYRGTESVRAMAEADDARGFEAPEATG